MKRGFITLCLVLLMVSISFADAIQIDHEFAGDMSTYYTTKYSLSKTETLITFIPMTRCGTRTTSMTLPVCKVRIMRVSNDVFSSISCEEK